MKHYNIPIFVPHEGCPFDCVFCNQKHITGSCLKTTKESIEKTIEKYLKTLPKQQKTVEVAFFGGSFTGIDFDIQGQFLSIAHKYLSLGKIDGIRLSTRPDYINIKILDQLKKYGVTTIELGVQSLDEDVLTKSNRGHSVSDVFNAVELIKKYNFSLGLQMMTGLPGDTDEKSIETAKKIIELSPDFVRIYPTLVVKDTMLEVMYNNGEYVPQSLDEAVSLCKKLLILFEKNNIDVIRIALQTTDEICPGASLVAGPFDFQFRELVESQIYYELFCDYLKKNPNNYSKILVNPKEISKATGKSKINIKKIYDKYKLKIKILGDINLAPREFLFR